jgi:hypothetical protein
MNDQLKDAVNKALQKNHRNGPINANNLVSIFGHIIEENQNLSADQIAALINEAEQKSEGDEDDNQEEE